MCMPVSEKFDLGRSPYGLLKLLKLRSRRACRGLEMSTRSRFEYGIILIIQMAHGTEFIVGKRAL
jgi:hypothetical protein